MPDLEVRLFGGLEVRRAGELLPPFSTRCAQRLFAYLVLNAHRPIDRNVVCGSVWPDRPDRKARKALRTALWRVRALLEPEDEDAGTLFHVEGRLIGFPGTGSVWVDTEVFESRMQRLPPPGRGPLDEDQVRQLSDAVALYRGDLLEGMYDDWCISERERLRLAHLRALERLIRHHERRGEWPAVLTQAQAVLRLDPLREHVHRTVMRSHWAMGNRPSALRQYHRCVRILREELQIDPMKETRTLFERIRNGARLAAPADPRGNGGPPPLGAVPSGEREVEADDLDSVVMTLHAVTRWLERRKGELWNGDAESA